MKSVKEKIRVTTKLEDQIEAQTKNEIAREVDNQIIWPTNFSVRVQTLEEIENAIRDTLK